MTIIFYFNSLRVALIACLFFLSSTICFGKIDDDSLSKSNKSNNKIQIDTVYRPLKEIKWNGYARTYFYSRNLTDKYFDTPGGAHWYSIGAGWGQPLLRLTGRINPYKNTGFEIEYTMNTPLYEKDDNESQIRNVVPLQTLNFQSNFNTNYGKFRFAGGGVMWIRQTPMTLGGFRTRYDYFERVPWEGSGYSSERYNKWYGSSTVEETKDSRFGSAAVQGVQLEGSDLFNGFGFSAIVGKTNFSGGYQSWMRQSPKKIQSYRIFKRTGQSLVGLNYSGSFGETTQSSLLKEAVNIFTTDINFNIGPFTIISEIGTGSYVNPKTSRISGEAINVMLTNNINFLKIPFTIQYFHVSPNFVNPNSELQNSSIGDLSQSFGDSTQLNTRKGGIFDIGQLTNNRQALNLTLEKTINKFKIGVGISSGQELVNLYNEINFQHRLNRIGRAQFNFYQSRVGPYRRIYSTFLTTFESIHITNPGDINSYKKGFNILDLSLKYKFWLFNRQIILSNYTNYNTVQKGFSVIPVDRNKAFLTYIFNEFITVVGISSKVNFITLIGLERVMGNGDTEVASNGKNVDQTGTAYGLGLDYDITDKVGVFIRHRWFEHKDPNFTLDKFKGHETGVEFKLFF